MSKIALFGAAGVIGQSIAAALSAQRRPYRVVGRSEASLRRHFGADPLAEIVTWNPDSPASVQAAAERRRDAGLHGRRRTTGSSNSIRELMRKTLDGAIAAGRQAASC